MQKQKMFLECDCGMDVIGFSRQHASQNLKIHKNISKKHKEFMWIKKKILKKLKSKNS